MTVTPGLLCTDTIAERYGHRLATAAPSFDVVPLVGKDQISEADIARVDAVFFSSDAHPDRTSNILAAALSAPKLRWLHTFSAGIDHPVFDAFRERGVRITTSSGASAAPIARTVMLYLLGHSRDIRGVLRDQAAHVWEPRPYDDIEGKVIGVVGMGPIGLEVVRMSAALGMRPIGMRRAVLGDEPCETWTLDRLPELAATADVLVLALPLVDETRGLMSASVLAAMRPGTFFVNVGRGELVDEAALVAALTDGHLGGAGLDVFATEPLGADSPLWDLPNVILTPHNSANTAATADGAVEIFLTNFARYERGEPLANER